MARSVGAHTARRGYPYLATASAMTRLWRGTDQPAKPTVGLKAFRHADDGIENPHEADLGPLR
jgi:hypothetical protein